MDYNAAAVQVPKVVDHHGHCSWDEDQQGFAARTDSGMRAVVVGREQAFEAQDENVVMVSLSSLRTPLMGARQAESTAVAWDDARVSRRMTCGEKVLSMGARTRAWSTRPMRSDDPDDVHVLGRVAGLLEVSTLVLQWRSARRLLGHHVAHSKSLIAMLGV